VNDWAEHLTIAIEVKDFNDDKLFNTTKWNLCNQIKEWFKKLNLPLAHWTILKIVIVQKFGDVDVDEIRVKLDKIK